jgi:hypothetical protein
MLGRVRLKYHQENGPLREAALDLAIARVEALLDGGNHGTLRAIAAIGLLHCTGSQRACLGRLHLCEVVKHEDGDPSFVRASTVKPGPRFHELLALGLVSIGLAGVESARAVGQWDYPIALTPAGLILAERMETAPVWEGPWPAHPHIIDPDKLDVASWGASEVRGLCDALADGRLQLSRAYAGHRLDGPAEFCTPVADDTDCVGMWRAEVAA